MSYAQYSRFEEKMDKGLSEFGLSDELLSHYVIVLQQKEEGKKRPFYYFYEDVIEKQVTLSFENILGVNGFRQAQTDAAFCIELVPRFKKMHPDQIYNWLSNALKFSDHLVLFCIQDIIKVPVKKYDGFGTENSRYKQLSEENDKNLSVVGSILKNLYEHRNKMEHRTVIKAGRQELIMPKYSKFQREAAKHYPNAMNRLLEYYLMRFSDKSE